MSSEWWRDELVQREAAGLYRRLRELPPDAIDLASNDYLGLALHPEVIAASQNAVAKFGAGARASRLISGHTAIHTQLEKQLAAFKGTDAALLFASGYQANIAVVSAFARPGDLVLCDKRNHASLIDACFLAKSRGAKVRFYDSPGELQTLLDKTLNEDANVVIVSDAVYSMDGDLADVRLLLHLSQTYEALLILDDAHGTGTLGSRGRGAMEYSATFAAAMNSRVIQTGTLSKALGSQGGFVAASKSVVEWLINGARGFIYSTGLLPAACGAASQALQMIQEDSSRLARLHAVNEYLARELSTLGYAAQLQPAPIIPVVVGDARDAQVLSARLLEHGVWCPAIRPPTVPAGSSRLRVTASAGLTDDAMERVLAAFKACRSI